MQGGQHHNAAQTEVLSLTAASRAQQEVHQAMLLDLEAKKIAASLNVPTLPEQVRAALREMGQPVRLFGENLADVRQRLREAMAHQKVSLDAASLFKEEDLTGQRGANERYEEEVTKYTRAEQELIEARQAIANFSLQRAGARLERERRLRLQANRRKRKIDEKPGTSTEVDVLDESCHKMYQSIRMMALQGSQYGDSRVVSCISAQTLDGIPVVATGGWTGSVQLWDGSSSALEILGGKTMCHEDRIMGLDTMKVNEDLAIMATTSIDLTAKLYRVQSTHTVMLDDAGAVDSTERFAVTEQAVLHGHQSRLCRAAFHPMQRHVATTSFDHTWRLWDIETSQNILLQDGHWKECYGVGFHPDGSLCATTDFGGIVQVWDLRTGKSIKHFLGHAKRVLNAIFHPNGFQLATAGDDGTIKIWDLRRRKLAASLPAHSNVVTKLQFDASGEYLASSSYDGTARLWGCRDWKMLRQLQAHEGKLSGIEILGSNSILTCGFDKTLKLWQ
jgi:U4/U6 small nuclear ribonucleoprotein PRP4